VSKCDAASRPLWSESERLAALRSFQVLDTAPEASFDAIARVAAQICQAPIGLVSLIDEERQWFKAEIGLGMRETPREASICAHALEHHGLFIVPDTLEDPRFARNPLVTGAPHVRFYAGVRLETDDGLPLGTLCVFGRSPRPEGLSEEQAEALMTLARAVMSHLDLKRLNAALAKSENRFKTLVDTIPQIVWTATPEGIGDYYNRRWYEFTGHPGCIPGKQSWTDALHPDDLRNAWQRWRHAVETGEDYESEYRVRHQSGTYRWVLARAKPARSQDGRIERWFGTTTDIDDHKMAEAALARSEERHRALLEASAMVFWTACPDGQITHGWGWRELSGQTDDEYPGQGWLNVVHPEDRERVVARWQGSLASGEFYESEFRVRHVDGAFRWVSARAVPLRNHDRTIREWVGILTDIDERKRAEAALRISEERLRLAVETTSLGIWDADLVNDQRKWPAEARQILGLSDGAPITQASLLERVHPEDRSRVEAQFFANPAGRGETFGGEFRIIRADNGCERWVVASGRTFFDEAGRPIRKIGTIQDITPRKRAEEALLATLKRLRLALHAGRMVAWEQDLRTGAITSSDTALELFGIGPESPEDFLERIHPEDRAELEAIAAGQEGKASQTVEFRFFPPNGPMLWLRTQTEKADAHRLIGITYDITDRKRAEEEVWRVANHDPLTGLPNRALLQRCLEDALAKAHHDGTGVSLLVVDLDHFKDVNDTLGHDAGDALLRETARRLSEIVGDRGTIARLGGDEFAVVITETLTAQALSDLAHSMLEKLREPFFDMGRLLVSRASIGIARYPDHDANPAELMKDADIALYRAKADGRNRMTVYSPSFRAMIEHRVTLGKDVRLALSGGHIIPYYQPKVCLSTGKVVGLEALARWAHPRGEILTPGYFGAVFDDPEIAVAIGRQLVAAVAADVRGWIGRGLNPGRVAINLSSAEFSQPSLAEGILAALERHGISPANFEVEVTETVLLGRGADVVAETLRQFHEQGILVALDDFGTGYASLTHLKQFPVGHIKIDRSFVMNLEQDAGDEAIVAAIIGLGRNMGMQITAEGVETPGQAERLRALGCHNAQGYLFSRPVAGALVPELLSGTVPKHGA